MAVDNTPERSFSDLFSSARGAGDDRMHTAFAEMRRRHHRAQRRLG
jgi:hypothetical protein